MIWDPDNMLLYDVLRWHGGTLERAGLKRIGRKGNGVLILTYLDGTVELVPPGEVIPLPRRAQHGTKNG